MGKIKIPKNRDIEEFVEECEVKENLQNANRTMQDKKTEFKRSIRISNNTQKSSDENNQEIYDDKIEIKHGNFLERRKAQEAEKTRQKAYLKAMDKIKEVKDENEEEIQQFFDEIQKKTDEYLKTQDEEEKIKQEEKYGEKYKIKQTAVKNDKKDEEDKENQTKRNQKKGVSGTSMEEILNSQEFKEMWEESQEER